MQHIMQNVWQRGSGKSLDEVSAEQTTCILT